MVGIYGNRVAGYLGGIGNPTDGKQLGNPCRSVGGYGVFLFSFLATIHERRWQWPNDPKLRCGGPGTPPESTAAQGEGAGCAGLGGGAQPVTEPVGTGAGQRKLNAMPAVTCSAWLGVAGVGKEAA